jgi:DNA-binding beta-propeller fold protein YncE
VVTVLAHHVGGGLPAGVSIGPSPSGSIACDAHGNIYVTDTNNDTIRKISPVGVVTTVAGGAGSPDSTEQGSIPPILNVPSGIACDAAGNLYVVDFPSGNVLKIAVGH